MARVITENPTRKYILESVETFLNISERAESASFTINVNKTSVPTISYSVRGFSIMYKQSEGGGDI